MPYSTAIASVLQPLSYFSSLRTLTINTITWLTNFNLRPFLEYFTSTLMHLPALQTVTVDMVLREYPRPVIITHTDLAKEGISDADIDAMIGENATKSLPADYHLDLDIFVKRYIQNRCAAHRERAFAEMIKPARDHV